MRVYNAVDNVATVVITFASLIKCYFIFIETRGGINAWRMAEAWINNTHHVKGCRVT
jgi:hypothetical protein